VITNDPPPPTCGSIAPLGPSLQAVSKCAKCPCGRVMCLGNHYSTSTAPAQAAQPAYADPDCVSNDLVDRLQVCVDVDVHAGVGGWVGVGADMSVCA
jgi:hypothetical protein